MALRFCWCWHHIALLPFLLTLPFVLTLAHKLFLKYKPYILVTVSLQFLHGDIVVLYYSSEWSATPTKFVIINSHALPYLVLYNILIYILPYAF